MSCGASPPTPTNSCWSWKGASASAPGIASLKLGYNRVQGFFIEIPRRDAERVPKDYIRRQTVKSAERFITAELQELRGPGARARASARWRASGELYEQVLTQLIDALGPLQASAAALAELDALAALGERAVALEWSRPELSAEARLTIEGGRHPVVERFADAPFVPNDLRLDAERRMLIITGPNMGGKSTYMRQAALIALLAHIGSYVPADRALHRSARSHLHAHRRGGRPGRRPLHLHGGNDRSRQHPAQRQRAQPDSAWMRSGAAPAPSTACRSPGRWRATSPRA